MSELTVGPVRARSWTDADGWRFEVELLSDEGDIDRVVNLVTKLPRTPMRIEFTREETGGVSQLILANESGAASRRLIGQIASEMPQVPLCVRISRVERETASTSSTRKAHPTLMHVVGMLFLAGWAAAAAELGKRQRRASVILGTVRDWFSARPDGATAASVVVAIDCIAALEQLAARESCRVGHGIDDGCAECVPEEQAEDDAVSLRRERDAVLADAASLRAGTVALQDTLREMQATLDAVWDAVGGVREGEALVDAVKRVAKLDRANAEAVVSESKDKALRLLVEWEAKRKESLRLREEAEYGSVKWGRRDTSAMIRRACMLELQDAFGVCDVPVADAGPIAQQPAQVQIEAGQRWTCGGHPNVLTGQRHCGAWFISSGGWYDVSFMRERGKLLAPAPKHGQRWTKPNADALTVSEPMPGFVALWKSSSAIAVAHGDTVTVARWLLDNGYDLATEPSGIDDARVGRFNEVKQSTAKPGERAAVLVDGPHGTVQVSTSEIERLTREAYRRGQEEMRTRADARLTTYFTDRCAESSDVGELRKLDDLLRDVCNLHIVDQTKTPTAAASEEPGEVGPGEGTAAAGAVDSVAQPHVESTVEAQVWKNEVDRLRAVVMATAGQQHENDDVRAEIDELRVEVIELSEQRDEARASASKLADVVAQQSAQLAALRAENDALYRRYNEQTQQVEKLRATWRRADDAWCHRYNEQMRERDEWLEQAEKATEQIRAWRAATGCETPDAARDRVGRLSMDLALARENRAHLASVAHERREHLRAMPPNVGAVLGATPQQALQQVQEIAAKVGMRCDDAGGGP